MLYTFFSVDNRIFMKVPLNWLKKYIPLSQTPQQIADALTLQGLEVESIEGENYHFNGVIIVKIDSVASHPNADRLKVAKVFDGKEYYQVVCGDQTIQPGMIVPFAKAGANLLLDTDSPLKIKKGKIRDVESEGMLAGLNELSLIKEKAPTVYHLPLDAPLGMDLKDYLYNPILDVTLTPNLGHCRSILGIVRELSASLQIPYTLPRIPKIAGNCSNTSAEFTLTNNAPKHCPTYTARLIKGVRIGPSPNWLAEALESAGIRPINVIVDITNYVMLELGQPMHAFDAEKLAHKQIVIEEAQEEISITLLDQKTYQIPKGTLMIFDHKTPIAIAGIMGGLEASVSENTRDILLEVAAFSSSIIRQKSRELSLRSESSSRFENEIDRGGLERAMDRAAELIAQLAGGQASSDCLISGSLTTQTRFVSTRVSHINRLLGTNISLNEAVMLLQRLEFEVTTDNSDVLQVKIPSFRNDVHLEVDIIEEVGKLYGYNRIERKSPLVHNSDKKHNPYFLLERKLKKRLVSEGLQEFITCNLVSPELAKIELENGFASRECVSVLKPSSIDQSVLRSSVLSSHLLCLARNKNVGCHDLYAFEIGHIHFQYQDRFEEKMVLAITCSGKNKPHHCLDKPRKLNFFDLKGIVENTLSSLSLDHALFTKSNFAGFHPNQQAAIYIDNQQIGVIGSVHPKTLEHFDIEEEVFFAEIELSALTTYLQKQIFQKPLPQFPSSERDLTITIPKKQSLDLLFEKCKKLKQGALKDIQLLDIYEHPSIGEENKNVTLRFTYRDDSSTLDYDTVENLHKESVHKLVD
ncbi:MAG: phenylalanine--tRNA ligase subunit beta [Chlamydiae bacterium]|nr:phenylalanine--tRNA ligase subunit beta [Chlamydiota bacterium]